jgi:small subunit ribosomal protein S8
MTSNYILSDFVSRINVATRGHLKSVKVLNTKLTRNILTILYQNGLISKFVVEEDEMDAIYVFLKYYRNKMVCCKLEVISKPSKRVYFSLDQLSSLYNKNSFAGFYIISTAKGLVTSNDCLLFRHTSGEVLLKVSI